MRSKKSFDDEVSLTRSSGLPSGVSGVHQAIRQSLIVSDPRRQVDRVGSIAIDSLYAVFEPIMDLCDGETVGLEVHARCAAEGLADPEDLFARANFEKSIGDLGSAVRALAVRQCAGRDLYLPVHPAELKYGNLVRPDDPIASHEGHVWLELSQTTFAPLAMQIIRELQARSGVSLVIDDLGSGPASLKHLIELEPAAIKLHRELISGLDQNRRKRATVQALVVLCEELDAIVIAKGVDSEPELQAVRDCGIRYAQGKLIGVPSALPTISVWPSG